ncbi:MAG TPA: DUF937 domain-containing protein [Chitinophagaceae bacterium]
MFDQILQMVKNHLGNNPQISSAIPPGQQDAIHQEIATHLTNGIQNQAATQGGAGGLLSALQGSITSGNPIVNAIEGGLMGSLGSKFGLSPMVTGAIAASLPGLLQKFARKANDPNDNSITPETITQSLPGNMGSGLGGLLNRL